jgi:Ni/Co efflux regulator RcnB
MKRFLISALALSLLGGAAFADEHDYYRHDEQHHHDRVHWSKGDRYAGHYVEVTDWRGHHLRRPPHGYHWVQTDDGDFVLVAVSTGIILDLMLNGR